MVFILPVLNLALLRVATGQLHPARNTLLFTFRCHRDRAGLLPSQALAKFLSCIQDTASDYSQNNIGVKLKGVLKYTTSVKDNSVYFSTYV